MLGMKNGVALILTVLCIVDATAVSAQELEVDAWISAQWTSRDDWATVRTDLDKDLETIKSRGEHGRVRAGIVEQIKGAHRAYEDNPSSAVAFDLAFWTIQLQPYANGTSNGIDKKAYKIDWTKYGVDSSREWARLRFLHGSRYSSQGSVRAVSGRIAHEFPQDRSVYRRNLIYEIASENDAAKEMDILRKATTYLDTADAVPPDLYMLAYAFNLSRNTLGNDQSVIDTAINYYEMFLEKVAPDHPLKKLARASLEFLKKL